MSAEPDRTAADRGRHLALILRHANAPLTADDLAVAAGDGFNAAQVVALLVPWLGTLVVLDGDRYSALPAADAPEPTTPASQPDWVVTADRDAIRSDLTWRFGQTPYIDLRTYKPNKGHLWVGNTPEEVETAVNWVVACGQMGQGAYSTFNEVEHLPKNRPYANATHFVRRKLAYIDCDPIRDEGDSERSATDGERAAVNAVAESVITELRDRGLGEPCRRLDTGSGQALYYLIESGVDERVYAGMLEALNARHGTAAVKIDPAVKNLARVSRIAGSINCKGKTHRHCRLISAAAEPLTLTAAQVLDIAGDRQSRVPFAAEPPRTFDPPPDSSGGMVEPGDIDQPGEDLNQRNDWWAVLTAMGAKSLGTDARGVELVVRPGKDASDGGSATLGFVRDRLGRSMLYVFSSSWRGLRHREPYSLFGVYTAFYHGGDFTKSVKDLRAKGYGKPLPPPPKIVFGSPRPASPDAAPGGGGAATAASDAAPPSDGGDNPPAAEPRYMPDGRLVVQVTPDQFRVNEEAERAFAADSNVFQMGQVLMTVRPARELGDADPVKRPPDQPVTIPLEAPVVRHILTRNVFYYEARRDRRGEEHNEQCHPPDWHVNLMHKWRQWPTVRPLNGLSCHPLVLADGRVLARPGYDPESGLMISPNCAVKVPSRPTRDIALRAVAALYDIIDEFPFKTEAHKSSWLASLLTPIGWFGFTGSAPWFVTEANSAGSGKTKIAHCVPLILTGRPFGTTTFNPKDETEFKKTITSFVAAGDRMVCFDNLEGKIGNGTLAAYLTAERFWNERILGASVTYTGPMNLTNYGTGNNIIYNRTVERRVCPTVLENQEENPEDRKFKYPDLLAHVKQNRAKLLSAAVTILAAYHAAGAPEQELTPWGSFESWSQMIRRPIVWCGLPDPILSRHEMRLGGDEDKMVAVAVLTGWMQADSRGEGLTAQKAIDIAFHHEPASWKEEWREALAAACNCAPDKVTTANLGYYLRSIITTQMPGGLRIVKAPQSQGANQWRVERLSNRKAA